MVKIYRTPQSKILATPMHHLRRTRRLPGPDTPSPPQAEGLPAREEGVGADTGSSGSVDIDQGPPMKNMWKK